MSETSAGSLTRNSYSFLIHFSFDSNIEAWTSKVVNNAAVPSLFLSYVRSHFFADIDPSIHIEQYGILVCITLILTFVNFRGIEVVGWTVNAIFFVSMMPVILMVVMGIPKGACI